MNDQDTLGFYTTIQLFRNNPEASCATLQFPPTLTPQQRRIVRSLAEKFNLQHSSHGVGQERFVTVTRGPTPPQQPQRPSSPLLPYRPIPTTRASTEHLTQPPLSPRHDLRASRSLTNLRAERPHIPPFPAEFSLPYSPDLFAHRLGHRSSQESAVSSGNRSTVYGSSSFQQQHQPTRQPHGPPQDTSRGFDSTRPPITQIRPIGHGAKTPSYGSLSHGSGSRESRGGSDSILDLQSSIQPPHEY
jgi:R3H domain